MKKVQVRVLAKMTTTLEHYIDVEVDDDATDSDILAQANMEANDIDGGEFTEVDNGGDWYIYDTVIVNK